VAFKPPKKPVQFAHLKQTLSTADPDNALYQTVQAIIEKLTQFQNQETEEKTKLKDAISSISGGGSGGGTPIGGNLTATYITKANETADLSNSIQLLAGTNITFDDTVANQRTINSFGGSSVSNYYDSPLTDGDLIETELIFAAGECIIVQVPT